MTTPSTPRGPEHVTEFETVTVRKDDLRLIMDCTALPVLPSEDAVPLNDALARCAEALEATESGEEGAEPPLPPGRYARVEIPGFRQNTGWVTEETRFGVQCAVVRDWNGAVDAEVVIGPGSRVVYLPTPLRRPEAQAALPAGDDGPDGEAEDAWADDRDGEPF